jgi:hypothetical protein
MAEPSGRAAGPRRLEAVPVFGLQGTAGLRVERQQGGGEREQSQQGFQVHDESSSKKPHPGWYVARGRRPVTMARKCSQSAKPAAALTHQRGTPVLRFRGDWQQRLQPG